MQRYPNTDVIKAHSANAGNPQNALFPGLISGVAVLCAAVIGAQNGPQRPLEAAWYTLLRKPPFTPPGPLIGGAWAFLELSLIGAGYRLLRAQPSTSRRVAVGAWLVTLIGLAGYPWVFFRKKRLESSTAAAGAMFVSATGMAIAAARVDKIAAAAACPLVLWLGFATVLSEEIWRRNPFLSRD